MKIQRLAVVNGVRSIKLCDVISGINKIMNSAIIMTAISNVL